MRFFVPDDKFVGCRLIDVLHYFKTFVNCLEFVILVLMFLIP
jgi:hypothetical protein